MKFKPRMWAWKFGTWSGGPEADIQSKIEREDSTVSASRHEKDFQQ